MKKKIGLTKKVVVIGEKDSKEVAAIFDTGGKTTSIDKEIAEEVGLGETVDTTEVKNPSYSEPIQREVKKVKIKIDDDVYEVKANIQDRSHMTHKVLIGRNILHGNYVVDVTLSHDNPSLDSLKKKEVKKLL